ncbi:glycoside hydrolase family 3 protein [Cadophora sp. DSE1049]|nr:glycoside hydrolase family 3 protein [Cadophora sp. DSE1049]
MRSLSTPLVAALLFPLTLAAQNSTTTNTTATDGILSSGAVDLGDWADAYAKAAALVAQLTNEEKVTLITGGSVSSVNWTALEFKDGTEGVQGYNYVTGFSQSSALAMTWDKALMYDQMKAVALEFYGKGFQVVNGPTSQPLGRTPWGGRLVEAFTPDPYLNGIAFGLGAKSFNDAGVVAGGKHFLLNEQETNRQASGSSSVAPYSSAADDKTLHETYLWSFYDGVKNGLGAIMCAMTKVNGTLSCKNEELLQNLLKTELGFPGLVYADVGGQSTAFVSANGGLDFGSSSIWSNSTLQSGLTNGSFTQARLDDMAIRNVIGYYKVALDNGTQPAYVGSDEFVDVRANHSKIVRTNGAASFVLLKNTNNALPLSKPHTMVIFGSHAGPIMAGPNYIFSVQGSGPIYEGHLAGGSGSGQTSFPYLITPQQALTNQASLDGTMIRWILNNTYTSTTSVGSGGAIAGPTGGTSLSQTISDYATSAEICMVFINALSGEGADRTELRNTEQDELVTSVASNCDNTMVIVNTVGARILDAWIENENVTAVIYGGLLGQESGNSLLDVLYGMVNPSGRLTHTIAKNESDYNVGLCTTAVCEFTEGNYIDYRYFDKYNVTPRYEFGYGLSYTTFEYSGMTANITNATALASTYPTGALSVGGKTDLWDDVISVSVSVTNNGAVDGNEVSQLYVQYPAAADQPIRQLRGFERTLIASGSSATVTFSVRRRDISSWDVEAQDWAVVSGDYIFSVGGSSRDLRVSQTVTVGA